MKKFILNSVKTALVLGAVSTVYDQVGAAMAGDYFNFIWWAILLLTIATIAFITWRLYVGIESGYLLFDDIDD